MIRPRRSLNSLLLFICTAPAILSQTPPPAASSFRITGTVVSTTIGSPIPHCHLVPTLIERGPNTTRRIAQQDGADTDEQGHFVIQLPSAGSWSLRASARGYRAQLYDQHENFSSAIVLTQQTPTLDLLFRIAPDSAITGVILDEGSEPVRQAQVSVFAVPHAGADGSQANRSRSFVTTDDRGHYEVAGLAPGDYRISVSARPWYAQATQSFRGQQRPDTPQLEPSLDVVYPTTWFPGTTSEDTAETVTLLDGETRQADMQLLPIPSVHLRIPLPASETTAPDGTRRPVPFPQVSNISGNGLSGIAMSTGQGQLDVGGLSPGTYRVQAQDENGRPGRSTIVEVTANSARTIDLAAVATTATVNLKIDGGPGTESLPVTFVDANNERKVFRSGPAGEGGFNRMLGFQGGPLQNGQPMQPSAQPSTQPKSQSSSDRATRIVDLAPGSYLVYQNGSANFFLSGMTLGTKQIPGRKVTIPSGESSLTIHIATGRATISGIATKDSKPDPGAMVLLVPITMNEPGTIAELRRDQTNTDGSYDLDFVIPGQYILIAIDHGWNINWSDPATLSHYLSNGIPLDLSNPSTIKQNIEAQRP